MLLRVATLAWAAVQTGALEQSYGCEPAEHASVEMAVATSGSEGQVNATGETVESDLSSAVPRARIGVPDRRESAPVAGQTGLGLGSNGTQRAMLASDGVDSECLLSPSILAGDDVLIDQRPRVQHEAWPIPDTLYGVPSDVGTMKMFAPKRVVLIGSGRDEVTLIRRCLEYRENGVEHVFVLVGGVRSLVEAKGFDVPPSVRDRLYLLSSTELLRLTRSDAIVLLVADLHEDKIRIWRELLKLPVQPAGELLGHKMQDPADVSQPRVILLSDGDSPVDWMVERQVRPDSRLYFFNQSPDAFRRSLALAETVASNAYKPLPSGACGR